MATKLNADVVRETEATFRDKGKDKPIVVKVHRCNRGGACITLSLKGTRGEEMTIVMGVKSLYSRYIFKKHGYPR